MDIKAESRALRRHTVFKAAITNSLGNFLTIIGSWVVIPNFEISFNFKVLAIIIGVFAAINFGFAITYNNKFLERKKRLYELFYNTFTVILDIAVGLLLVNQGREFGFLSPQHLATWLFVVASIESHASYLFHKPKFFLLVMTCLHLPSGIWLISYGTIEGYICAGLIFGYAPMIMDRILRLKELSDNTIDAIVDSQKQRQINEQSVRLANLGRMASGIAHEINNPLAIADGLAVILKNHIERDIFDTKTAKDKLEKISASHERIKEVVLRMKGFSVDNSSRILENVNFYEIVETNLSFFAEKLNVHEITLRTENLDRKLSYPCNKEEITQIVLSFFTNAVDAIQESKDLERKEISIFSSSTRDSVTISVSDTGNTLEDSDEIFTPFYTTKEPGKGFGLGLSLAQYLANSYNGKIEGQRLDDRTIFTLTLPKV